jgi:hypothetical protein
MCDATIQSRDAGVLVERQEHLALLLKVADYVFRQEVEVDLRYGEPIVA